MLLTLWAVLVALALCLIVLGLSKPEESAQALIGFLFLFLLSFSIINTDLEYKTGEFVSTNYTYSAGNLSTTSQSITYAYDSYGSHTIGFYLALGSGVGFILVIFGLRNTRRMEDG